MEEGLVYPSWLPSPKEELAALVLLYSLPHPLVLEARGGMSPWASAKELYGQLRGRLAAAVGGRVLAALGLPEAIFHEGEGAAHVEAVPYPYSVTGAHCFELLAGDERCQVVMAASLAKLELRERPGGLQEAREVLALLPKAQLALALFYPESCRADGLGFLKLLELLDEEGCDEALVAASVAAHLDFMQKQRREHGYRLTPVVLDRVLREALEEYCPVQESVYVELMGHFSNAQVLLRQGARSRLLRWQLLNGRLTAPILMDPVW
jgi:hypothetical protein